MLAYITCHEESEDKNDQVYVLRSVKLVEERHRRGHKKNGPEGLVLTISSQSILNCGLFANF